MDPMLTSADVEALLAELSEAVAAAPLDRSKVLDLIARGADPNARDEFGGSWFERALLDDILTRESLELLIEAGAHVDSDGEYGRPLCLACNNARPDLVECLLARGADPDIIMDEVETLLDQVESDRWYCEDNLGTAWGREDDQARIDRLTEIIELLVKAGAHRRSEMRASRPRGWVKLGAGASEEVWTRDGYLRLADIAGLSEEWLTRWRAWCREEYDPEDEGFLAAPPGFDRRRHNAEGLALARAFKVVAGTGVRVDFCAIDPDSEEAFASNAYVVSDVGGREALPRLPLPDARYAEEPGFYVEAKARVAPDFSAVTPVLEFYVGRECRFRDWTLQLGELARSCGGDGRYAIFVDGHGLPVDVWVTWTASGVLWHISRLSGEAADLTFKRAGYKEAVDDAIVSAHHVVRRAWVAVDKCLNRLPRITGIGAIEHVPPQGGTATNQVAYALSPDQQQVAARSRIWDACVRFAWTVNSRSLAALEDCLAERCMVSGDRRPTLEGRKAILNYLSVALTDASWRDAGDEIVAEIGRLWLTAEPCVLFWRGESRVSLAHVHSNRDGKITSVSYITRPDLVESVEGLGTYPGKQPHHHGRPPAVM